MSSHKLIRNSFDQTILFSSNPLTLNRPEKELIFNNKKASKIFQRY